ncbi:hypothetical protein Pmani_024866 [Petrolisthes manimaculis]|uniref:Uncharacterized protein n=1 Tax=Petrolisthes manimaculis TaxID=1843537 RepID=A0AAE1P6R2_9EUCA|nr:hypothetical protein Pmani_024866 [Petrolisthes manimaculis]
MVRRPDGTYAIMGEEGRQPVMGGNCSSMGRDRTQRHPGNTEREELTLGGLVAMEGGGGHFGRTRDKGAPHQGASRGEMEGNIGRYISLAHCLSRPLSPTTLYHNPHF